MTAEMERKPLDEATEKLIRAALGRLDDQGKAIVREMWQPSGPRRKRWASPYRWRP